MIQDADTPLTVGVFGEWGSGKTSLMRMVRDKLDPPKQRDTETGDVVTVWFEAWKFAREDVVWRALLMHTLTELRRRVQADEVAAHLFDHLEARVYEDVDYTETGQLRLDLKKLATGTIEVGSGLVPFGPALAGLVKGAGKLVGGKDDEKSSADGAKLDANGVNKLLDSVRRERIEVHKRRIQYTEEFQREFERLVHEHVCDGNDASKKRLVVFIDDLDRCLPKKVIQVFEAIKLFLEVKNTVFVVGVASEVVHRGIERWYGFKPGDLVDDGGKAFSGTDYLEKIIQLPFRLPTIDAERFHQFLEEHGRLLPEGCCELLALGMPPNPRKAKRTLNVFGLLLRLGEVRLKKDLNPCLLAKICVIQTRWPRVYNELVKFPVELCRLERLCEQIDAEVPTDTAEDDLLYDVASENQEIRRMMASDPRSQRIAVDILKRHFHLSVSGAVDTSERDQQADSPLFEQLVDEDERARREAFAVVKERVQSGEGKGKKELSDLARHIQDRVLDNPDCEYDARWRASMLDALGLIGDPRKAVTTVDAMEFRTIHEGPFMMGKNKEGDEKTHVIDIGEFWMGRYPVTNAQFARFVDAGGYSQEEWWTEARGAGFWTEEGVKGRHEREPHKGLPKCGEPFCLDNHPVVGVSWYEALAYCKWLTDKLRTSPKTPRELRKRLDEGWAAMSTEFGWIRSVEFAMALVPTGIPACCEFLCTQDGRST